MAAPNTVRSMNKPIRLNSLWLARNVQNFDESQRLSQRVLIKLQIWTEKHSRKVGTYVWNLPVDLEHNMLPKIWIAFVRWNGILPDKWTKAEKANWLDKQGARNIVDIMKVTHPMFRDIGTNNIRFSSYSALKHFLVNKVLIILIKIKIKIKILWFIIMINMPIIERSWCHIYCICVTQVLNLSNNCLCSLRITKYINSSESIYEWLKTFRWGKVD